MSRHLTKSRSAISTMLVAAIIVIIVVAVAAGAYVLTLPKTSPSGTPTPTPVPTSSPSAGVVSNFKAGAYANYKMTEYTNGAATVSSFNFTIGEDTYNGTPCWVLTTNAGDASSYIVIVENIDKSNTNQLVGNITMKMYSEGVLIYEDSFDPETEGFSSSGSATSQINPETIVGYETVTVPAGTFQNCAKATFPSTSATNQAQTSTVWISQNAPAFGMVKGEAAIDGVLSSTIELASYGGYP